MTRTGSTPFTGRTPFEVVLSDRQLALIAILLFALMMVVSGIAYVAGRIVAPAQVHGANAESNLAATIVVDPLPVEPGSGQPVKPVIRLLRPAHGERFLQVAVVEKGMAEATADYLARKGFEAYYAVGSEQGEYRVLVMGGSDIPKTQAALEAAGFRSFIRRY